MSEFDLQPLQAAENLIISYRGFLDEIIVAAKPLLKFAQECGVQEELEKHYQRSKTLLSSFKNNHLGRFDPFRIAGFVASENNFSDTIAALLDPKGAHGLGVQPLKHVLKKLPRGAEIEKIQAKLDSLDTHKENIYVQRESRRGDCIPDIVVISNDFIIYIENKIRGGTETISVKGEPQTVRHCRDLKKRAQKLNIPWVGIYLTPGGKSPREPDFIPLAAGELTSAIKEALDKVDGCHDRSLIRAFLDFYSWYN